MLNILQLAPLFYPIRPEMTYGGIERVIRSLDQCFTAQGHVSVTAALSGSKLAGRLLACPTSDYESQAKLVFDFVRDFGIDVIHIHRRNFLSTNSFKTLQSQGIPVLATLHGSADEVIGKKKYQGFTGLSNVFFNGLSRNQTQLLKSGMNVIEYIYNGVDPLLFNLAAEKLDYLLYLGRITRVKGVHSAISIAKDLGKKLVIAGIVLEDDQQYFDSQIVPSINNNSVCFVGPLTDQSKIDVLGCASALLMPIEWEDPCPLTVLEAMACGTPVVGYRRGALPELVETGVGGYLVDSYEALGDAILAAEKIDPQRCRQHAVDNFSWHKAADQYLDLYRRVIGLATHANT
ncbi:glycosyltransferase [Patescibacteria group bacterium]|nr:glycosyltransferase [Patescibacteria group bacterium]